MGTAFDGERRDLIKLVGTLMGLAHRATITTGQNANLGGQALSDSFKNLAMLGGGLLQGVHIVAHKVSPLQFSAQLTVFLLVVGTK